MKLSEYAKKLGISYRTAWRYYKEGKLNAYQTHTGTIIVREELRDVQRRAAIYCRVSSAEKLYRQWDIDLVSKSQAFLISQQTDFRDCNILDFIKLRNQPYPFPIIKDTFNGENLFFNFDKIVWTI
jgi:hypothetical protein